MKNAYSLSILLVDDNESDGTITRFAIRSVVPDARIRYFESGADVVAYLQKIEDPAEYPHLMLLDLNMPGVDGIEVLKLLKVNRLKHFPVYMLSGSTILGEERLSLKCGADAFYEKPRDFDDTVHLFNRILPGFLIEQYGPQSLSA